VKGLNESRKFEPASARRPAFSYPPLEGEGRLTWGVAKCETGWGDSLSSSVVLQWFDFGLSRTIQLNINPFENRSQITHDLRIPEANNAVSLLLKPKLSLAITLGYFIVVVMPAVQFNNQPLSWAEEVHNIRTDRCLASEVSAFYRKLFQSTPQQTLVRRRAGSQLLGCCSADVETISIPLADRSSHPARCASDPPPPGEGKSSVSENERKQRTKSRSRPRA